MKLLSTFLAACCLVIVGIAGCVCAEPKSGAVIAQIIVKFKDTNTSPATATLVKSLSDSAKLHVRHVRSMSGGAQIYVLSGAATDAALADAMKQISARPDVEYAEIDRKLKPEKEKSNDVQQK